MTRAMTSSASLAAFGATFASRSRASARLCRAVRVVIQIIDDVRPHSASRRAPRDARRARESDA
jgi:hypothetical protein